jgi:L-lactate dehydrogenase (cytochrome)
MRLPASVSDYRALAKARLPRFLFEYIDGGSYDEVTLERNVEDLKAIALRQRVLRDVSKIDLSTELFGKAWSMPVGLGPVGLSGLYARRGEVQAAKAAAAAGVPFALSTVSACSLEEVAACGHVPWFQL